VSGAEPQSGDPAGDGLGDEFREFVEGNALETSADPAFKERLCQRLWELALSMVSDRAAGRGDPS
jgi:hypothetical protein